MRELPYRLLWSWLMKTLVRFYITEYLDFIIVWLKNFRYLLL